MRSRPALPGIALVLLLHLVLLWLALRPVYQAVAHDQRVWLQLWQPSTKVAPPPPAKLRTRDIPAPAIAPSRITRATPLSDVAAALAPGAPPAGSAGSPAAAAASAAADTPEVQALLAEPAPATALAPDVVRQALKDVAAIDKQLRAEHPQVLTPSPGSANTRLARGIAAAGAAVKPKWFEQARIELFSAPNDPKRIYRVITAMGEYCLFYPDTGSIAFNADAKSGLAGAGQPKMSSCPTRF